MIARDLRLRSPIEFERVRSTGRSWSNNLVVAVILANSLGQNRYGFAVGKRVGNAVARNRAKRLMRESTRSIHSRLRQGHDVVFIARNRVDPSTTQKAIDEAIEAVLQKAGLVASGTQV